MYLYLHRPRSDRQVREIFCGPHDPLLAKSAFAASFFRSLKLPCLHLHLHFALLLRTNAVLFSLRALDITRRCKPQ